MAAFNITYTYNNETHHAINYGRDEDEAAERVINEVRNRFGVVPIVEHTKKCKIKKRRAKRKG